MQLVEKHIKRNMEMKLPSIVFFWLFKRGARETKIMENSFAEWRWCEVEKRNPNTFLHLNIVYSFNNFVNTYSVKQKELILEMSAPRYSQDTDSTRTQWWSAILMVLLNMMLALIVLMHMIVLFNKKNRFENECFKWTKTRRNRCKTRRGNYSDECMCVHSHTYKHEQMHINSCWFLSVCLSSFHLFFFIRNLFVLLLADSVCACIGNDVVWKYTT